MDLTASDEARYLATRALTAAWGTVRNEVLVERPADDVWRVIADAGRIAEWFPAFASSRMEGAERHIVMNTGLPLVEEICIVDHEQRRLQYRLKPNFLISDHRATVDVLAISATSSALVYGTDITPSILALTFGGGIGEAIENLKRMLEAQEI
jgi:Polyketide cyclase / dehydrase and lipid transport